MGEHRRKADGRRVFTTEFKRATVQRIVAGEKTVAELSRELDIAPSVIRNWKRFADAGATTAVQAREDVVPASQLREAYAKIRELERALGRKTMEVEILRAAQEVVKKRHRCAESPGGDHAIDDRDLRGPRDRPAVGVLRCPAPPRRPLSTRGRGNGPTTDSGGDEPPVSGPTGRSFAASGYRWRWTETRSPQRSRPVARRRSRAADVRSSEAGESWSESRSRSPRTG